MTEKKAKRRDPPSLHPVPFEEAVSDLLKVKPEPKDKPKDTKKGARNRELRGPP